MEDTIAKTINPADSTLNGGLSLFEKETEGEKLNNKRNKLFEVISEVKNGNFTVRMPHDEIGLFGKICDTLNEVIDMNQRMTLELARASNTIGKQGKLTQRLELPGARGDR